MWWYAQLLKEKVLLVNRIMAILTFLSFMGRYLERAGSLEEDCEDVIKPQVGPGSF